MINQLSLDVIRYIFEFIGLRNLLPLRRVSRRMKQMCIPHRNIESYLAQPTVITNVEVSSPGHIIAMSFNQEEEIHVLCRALEAGGEEEILLSTRKYAHGAFEFVGLENLHGMSIPRMSVVRGRVATVYSPLGRPYCIDCKTLRQYPTLPVSHLAATPDGSCLVGATEDGIVHVRVGERTRTCSLTVEPRFPIIDQINVSQTFCVLRVLQFANRYGYLSVSWNKEVDVFRQSNCGQSFAAHSEFTVDANQIILGEVVQGACVIQTCSPDFSQMVRHHVCQRVPDARYWKQIELTAGGRIIVALLHCTSETRLVILSVDGATLNMVNVRKANTIAVHPTLPIVAVSAWSETSVEHPLVAYLETGMITLIRFDEPVKKRNGENSFSYWIPMQMGLFAQALYLVLALTLVHLLVVKGWWHYLQNLIT